MYANFYKNTKNYVNFWYFLEFTCLFGLFGLFGGDTKQGGTFIKHFFSKILVFL
jgi:hypothetical protein